MPISKMFALAALIVIAPHLYAWVAICWSAVLACAAVYHMRRGD